MAPPSAPALLFSKVEPEIFKSPLTYKAPPEPVQLLLMNVEFSIKAFLDNKAAPALPFLAVLLMNVLFTNDFIFASESIYIAPMESA